MVQHIVEWKDASTRSSSIGEGEGEGGAADLICHEQNATDTYLDLDLDLDLNCEQGQQQVPKLNEQTTMQWGVDAGLMDPSVGPGQGAGRISAELMSDEGEEDYVLVPMVEGVGAEAPVAPQVLSGWGAWWGVGRG